MRNESSGMTVIYDGKKNTLLCEGTVKEYPIGGLACEYARLAPSELKPIFNSYPKQSDAKSADNATEALMWIKDELIKTQLPVVALMCFASVIEAFSDLMNRSEIEIETHLSEINMDIENDDVKKFILDGTGSNSFSDNTIGDMFSYAYYVFSMEYVVFKYLFIALTKSVEKEAGEEVDLEEYEKSLNTFGSMYSTELMSAQHFGFKLLNIEGKIQSIFTIESSVSLLVFEVAHLIETSTAIIKCKNCNNYFVSMGRSDTIYCDYPSPQDHSKKCNEIGPQITRAEKEKNDEATKLYRKVYMRYKMLEKRNPNENRYSIILKELVEGSKGWRQVIKDDPERREEYISWIQSYERKAGR